MANKTYYGIISDAHKHPENVPYAVEVLKEHGAEKIIVNGDTGNSQRDIAYVLIAVAKSGLETYVQPGSHETIDFEQVIDYLCEKYANINKILEPTEVKIKDHHLVFLPGSDWNAGGEYHIDNNPNLKSGKYMISGNKMIPINSLSDYVKALKEGRANGIVQSSNMYDLKKLVTDPDRTIAVCHIPRKFNNLEEAVDMAEFGEVEKDFIIENNYIKKGSIYPAPIAMKLVEYGYPIKIKKENRGNEDLKRIYEEIGINKALSAHLHESAHRANDSNGNHVPEDKPLIELFWNPSYIDKGLIGTLDVDDNKNTVTYHNIDINKYKN